MLSEEILNKRLELLRGTSIFSNLTNQESLITIASILFEYSLEPETPVFHKGDPSSCLYIIQSGSVIVHDGDHIFNVFVTGDIFGEYALIDDGVRSADVTTVSETSFLKLNKLSLEDHPETKVEVIRSLARLLTSRLRIYNQMESKLTEAHNKTKKQNEQIQLQTEELRAQAENLEKANLELEKLSIVASETTNAISILDAEGNYIWVNPSFAKMYGFNLNELIEKKGINIYDNPEFRHLTMQLNSKGQLDETVHVEYITQTKSGEKFWAKSTLTPIFGPDGEPVKIIVIDSDINEIKLAEAEIIHQKEEIQKQNKKISEAHAELFKKNEQVIDSINYAQRIQEAVLPGNEIFADNFSDFFIIYKPRNIVSGDFYWARHIEDENDHSHSLAIAVADCTGHGVPGAFMSMLGVTMLNELTGNSHIYENNHISPSEVLFKLRKKLITQLKQTGKFGEQKDGMDMSLCFFKKIITDNNEKKIQMEFSGANNPIYILRSSTEALVVNNNICESITENGESNIVLYEIKANKMPIGIHKSGEVPFLNNIMHLVPGDIVYLLSDGYCDQAGGEEETKFLKSRFKKLLLSFNEKSLSEQCETLNSELAQWQNNCQQTDDITVIGLKI